MLAIFKKELYSFFTSPIAYTIIAITWLFSGLFFYYVYASGTPDIGSVFGGLFIIILFVVPILTMRIFSEEKRQKTDQLLLTSPISLTSIVLGKYLAAMAMFTVALSSTLIFQLIIAALVKNAMWPIFFGNVVGNLLMASSLIAIGIFISSLTESQVVAAVGSFAVSLFLLMFESFTAGVKWEWFQTAVKWFSYNERQTQFTKGIFEYSNVLFFLSITAIFLFLAERSLDKKRWA